MSIDTYSVPKGGRVKQIQDLLLRMKYVKTDRFPLFPGPAGTRYFSWFEPEEYRSGYGIDCWLYPIGDDDRRRWATEAEACVRLRTSISASSFDRDYQNDTIRTIRREFGGFFENDSEGRNRYIKIDRPPSTPTSRGLYALRESVIRELSLLENALPDERVQAIGTPSGVITDEVGDQDVLEFTRRMGGSRSVYNALVPFVVASIEHFFSGAFQILLAHDDAALNRVGANRKIAWDDAVSLTARRVTLPELAASGFSFQNIDSIHKAFETFGISFWALLRRRRKVHRRLPILRDALEKLIFFRHGIVHRFELDPTLTKARLSELISVARIVITVMSDELERREGVELGPG